MGNTGLISGANSQLTLVCCIPVFSRLFIELIKTKRFIARAVNNFSLSVYRLLNVNVGFQSNLLVFGAAGLYSSCIMDIQVAADSPQVLAFPIIHPVIFRKPPPAR
jgi:hypothetical protein